MIFYGKNLPQDLPILNYVIISYKFNLFLWVMLAWVSACGL
jgi:hypothetical protein